jgi:peptidyl-prolyl cis-trans isomerase C
LLTEHNHKAQPSHLFLVLMITLSAIQGCANNNSTGTIVDSNENLFIQSPMGYELSSTKIEHALSALPIQGRDAALMNPGRFKEFVDKLLVRNALAEEGNQQGLSKQPNVMIKHQEAMREILAAEAIEQHWKSQEMPDFSILARQKYDLNQQQYTVPESVQVAHILVKTGTDERTDEQSEQLAQEILGRVNDGESFDELAREFSDDGSAANGGRLPSRSKRGQLVKPFEDVAFALEQPEDISDLVTTRFGYHIIKLIDKKPTHVVEYDKVKDRIKSDLKGKHIAMLKSHYIEQYQRPQMQPIEFRKLLDELNKHRTTFDMMPSQYKNENVTK